MPRKPKDNDSTALGVNPLETLKEKQNRVVPKAYAERCELELSTYREVRTARDVLSLNETLINSVIAKKVDSKEGALLGYLMAIQLQAIKAAAAEGNNQNKLDEMYKTEDVQIEMSPDDAKRIASATSASITINILNNIAEKQPKETKVTLDAIMADDADKKLLSIGKEAVAMINDEIIDIQPLSWGKVNEDDFED